MLTDPLTYDLMLEEFQFRQACRTKKAEYQLERLQEAIKEAHWDYHTKQHTRD